MQKGDRMLNGKASFKVEIDTEHKERSRECLMRGMKKNVENMKKDIFGQVEKN